MTTQNPYTIETIRSMMNNEVDSMHLREMLVCAVHVVPQEVDMYGLIAVTAEAIVANDSVRDDLARLSRAYLCYVGGRLDAYNKKNYIIHSLASGAVSMKYYSQYIFLNLVLNGVEEGDADSITVISNILKGAFKHYYQCLKRFRRITVSDICIISKDSEMEIRGYAVILYICRLLKIPFSDNCYRLCESFNMYAKEMKKETLDERAQPYPPEYSSEAVDFLEQNRERFEALASGSKKCAAFGRMRRVTKSAWCFCGFGAIHFDAFLQSSVNQEGVIHAYQVLKSAYPNQNFTLDELLPYAMIDSITKYYASAFLSATKYLETLFGLSGEEDAVTEANDIEKATLPSPEDEEPKTFTTVEEELTALRERCHRLESATLNTQILYQEEKKKTSHLQTLLEQHTEASEELAALREHVYHLTEEDVLVTQENLSSQEAFIKEKRIVVIGGHSNWTYKLKNRFPGWKFILPSPTGTADTSVVLRADYVYFFTDIITHSTYYRFVSTLRENSVAFGYIHSVNVESNIRQIYKDCTSRQVN